MRAEKDRKKREEEVLGYLDTVNDREREILSYLVQKNQQSFTADMGGELIATRKSKGLIEMGSGVHSPMTWPYTVPNFVWRELKRRQAEFNTANIDESPPWHICW